MKFKFSQVGLSKKKKLSLVKILRVTDWTEIEWMLIIFYEQIFPACANKSKFWLTNRDSISHSKQFAYRKTKLLTKLFSYCKEKWKR